MENKTEPNITLNRTVYGHADAAANVRLGRSLELRRQMMKLKTCLTAMLVSLAASFNYGSSTNELTVPDAWHPSHPQNKTTVHATIAIDSTYTPHLYEHKASGFKTWIHRCEVLSVSTNGVSVSRTGLFAGLSAKDELGSNGVFEVEARLVVPSHPAKNGEFKPILDVQEWKKMDSNIRVQGSLAPRRGSAP